MSKHKEIVKHTLNYLYGRIDNPMASDRERHRISLLALDQLEPEAPRFSLEGSTIAQVQSAVEGGLVSAQEALEFERANGERKTLMAWLEERL